LDRHAGDRAAKETRVDFLEGFAEQLPSVRAVDARRDRYRELVALVDVTSIDAALDLDITRRNAHAGQRPQGLVLHRREELFDLVPLQLVEPRQAGAGEVQPGWGNEQAAGRGDAGRGRNDHLRDAEFAGDLNGVDRPGSAGRDQREAARVLAAFGDVDAGRRGHILVDDVADACGDPQRVEGERRLQGAGDGPLRCLAVQRHRPAQEEVGVEVAEQQIGVGDGRLVAALPVAGRAGVGAGAIRPDGQQAELVDPGDRAAPGADLDQLDGGRADRETAAALEAVHPGDLQPAADRRAAILDGAQLGRGAAHVEGQHQWLS